MADRLISPVGIPATLAADGFWLAVSDYPDYYHPPQKWRSVNDYGNYYALTVTHNPDGTYSYSNYAYHTGSDLNLTLIGNSDADAHAPVVSLTDGVVTYAGHFPEPSTWGNLVIVRSQLKDGTPFWVRYAHMDAIHVTAGQTIAQGTQLGLVGNSFGRFPFHLHIDLSLSGKLETKPGDWPGLDLNRLHTDYVDILKWLRLHVNDVVGGIVPIPVPFTPKEVVVTTAVLNVRSDHDITAKVVRQLTGGDIATAEEIANGWYRIAPGEWISASFTADYVPPAPPGPVTDTIIDLSSDNTITDPVAFKAWIVANHASIIHRATWGDGSDGWLDSMFQARRAEYSPICTFGAYHQLNGDDPVKQAENFVREVAPDGKTPLATDVELAAATPAIAVIYDAHVNALTGVFPMDYTRANIWGDAPKGGGPLWIASQSNPPALPSKYDTWAIQQHGQTPIPGVAGLVDRDQSNGTPEQLTAFWPTISGKVIPVETEVLMVNTNGLRVRSGPGTTFTVLRTLDEGASVEVEKQSISGSNIFWRKFKGEAAYVAEQYLEKPYSVKYVNAVPDVALRSGPNTTYTSPRRLVTGTKLHVTDGISIVGGTHVWRQVTNIDNLPLNPSGWVAEEFIQDTSPTETSPVPPAPPVGPVLHSPLSLIGAHYIQGGEWLLADAEELDKAGTPIPGILNLRVGYPSELTPTQIKAKTPKTKVVERWNPGGYDIAGDLHQHGIELDWRKDDLSAAGKMAMQLYVKNWPIDHAADWHQIINEPPAIVNIKGWVSFWNAALDVAEAMGLHLTVLNTSYYHPALPSDAARGTHYRASDGADCNFWLDAGVIAVMRRVVAKGHALNMHEYIDKDWDKVGDWSRTGAWDSGPMARHEQGIALLPADCQGIIVILGEYGTGYGKQLGADNLIKFWKVADSFLHRGKANVLFAAAWSFAPWPSEPRSDLGPYRRDMVGYWKTARY